MNMQSWENIADKIAQSSFFRNGGPMAHFSIKHTLSFVTELCSMEKRMNNNSKFVSISLNYRSHQVAEVTCLMSEPLKYNYISMAPRTLRLPSPSGSDSDTENGILYFKRHHVKGSEGNTVLYCTVLYRSEGNTAKSF